MNCKKCTYNFICCSPDAWRIPITAREASSISPRIKLENGQFVLASKSNGRCYFQSSDGKCSIYDKRPETCRNFSCDGKEDLLKNLQSKLDQVQINLDSTHSGYVVAFIFSTDKTMNAGSLKITNPDNGKEIIIPVSQVFGNSEEEVRNKMIEVLKQPFKKEDI